MSQLQWTKILDRKGRDLLVNTLPGLGLGDENIQLATIIITPDSAYNTLLVTDEALVLLFVQYRKVRRSKVPRDPEVVHYVKREDVSQVAYKTRRLHMLKKDNTSMELGLCVWGSDELERLAGILDPINVANEGKVVRAKVPPIRAGRAKDADQGVFAPIPGSLRKSPFESASSAYGGTYRFFFSHASEEASIAAELTDELERNGTSVWLATRDIQAGENYAAQIYEAIEACSHLIVLLSPSSMSSQHVQREINLAIDQGKSILPVSVSDGTEFMATAPSEWKYWLGVVQMVPYSGATESVETLLTGLGAKK